MARAVAARVADWRFAIAREFVQNSIDAKSRNIYISIKQQQQDTALTVEDDGIGMDQSTLCDKLLALGESGKQFTETIGGFGKAKEILYLCHKSYSIETNNIQARGSGAQYQLAQIAPRAGTKSLVIIEGDETQRMITAFEKLISYTQWSGTFHLNGVAMKGELKKGAFRKDLGEWCKVYTNNSIANRLIVRYMMSPSPTPITRSSRKFSRIIAA